MSMQDDIEGLSTNNAYDPYTQSLVLTMPDGITQTAVGIDRIFALQNTAVQTAVIFGVQFGACSLLLLVLALMTRPDKRRSIVFILNILALVALLIRSILMFLTLTGPLYNFYNWVNGYYHDIGYTTSQSVAAEVFSFFVIALIELSMLFQVRIVCCTLSARWRHCITFASVLVAATVVGLRFALMILNADWGIKHVDELTQAQNDVIQSLAFTFNICIICSIFFFSAIFCSKLGHAIYQRRKMGMKQFGPMQIIFVMGCQTLFIPAIFGIASYFTLQYSQLYSIMPMVVATFLPLSSIWASTSTAGNVNIAAPQQWQNRKEMKQSNGRSGTYTSEKGLLPSSNNTDNTLIGDSGNDSMASPRKAQPARRHSERDSIDLEMAKMGHRIQVDRTYSVRSD